MSKLVIGNMKMNIISPSERERYFKMFQREIKGHKFKDVEMVLCPPSIHLESFSKFFSKNKKVSIGAQNVFWENKGSYTGEISPLMVKNMKVQYAIIGHSERRFNFGENNEDSGRKIVSCLKSGLVPIYCVGETKKDRSMGTGMKIVERQVAEGITDVSRVFTERMIIAYEPRWSVGTDILPTSNEIMEAKLVIKRKMTEQYGSKYAQKTRIIYGGSVSPRTVLQACINPGMDGVLIGRDSLVPMDFIKIAEEIDNN